MSKKEKTKLRDQVLLTIKTPFTLQEIPYQGVPQTQTFDIVSYRQHEWVLLFMDKKIWDELVTLCQARGLGPREVLYGSLMKLKKMLVI